MEEWTYDERVLLGHILDIYVAGQTQKLTVEDYGELREKLYKLDNLVRLKEANEILTRIKRRQFEVIDGDMKDEENKK